MTILSFIFCITGFVTLLTLAMIDARTWILPNKMNLLLGVLGIGFHASSSFTFLSPTEMALGALMGGGVLFLIGLAGDSYYKQETLGMGDVKLFLAGGLWLGVEGIVLAMTLGAAAGIIHGIGAAALKAFKEKQPMSLKRLMIPAGPGFCIGIAASFIWEYWDYFTF